MSTWTWEILVEPDLVAVGELLNPMGRTLSTALSRPATATCKIRLDDPLLPTIRAQAEMALLRITDEWGVPRYIGPIISSEINADASGVHVQLTSSDASWRFSKRVIGAHGPVVYGTLAAPAARTECVWNGVMYDMGAPIGLDVSSSNVGVGTVFVSYENAKASDIINELANALDGFEWQVTYGSTLYGTSPYYPTAGAPMNRLIGTLTMQAVIGGDAPRARWDFGGETNNVSSYRDLLTSDGMANRIVVGGYDRDYPQQITERGLYMDVPPLSAEQGIRNAILLANEHVRIRRFPRQQITFTPSVDLTDRPSPRIGPVNWRTIDPPGARYDCGLGDTVHFRAYHDRVLLTDAVMRLYGVTFTWNDKTGAMTPDVALIPGG